MSKRLIIPTVSAGSPDVAPEIRGKFARQFGALVRMHTPTARILDNRDLQRRHERASRLDAEADANIAVGFSHGYTLREIARRIRLGGLTRS